MEQEIGVALFVRYSNKVKLTESGHVFYNEVTRILSDLENAKSLITMEGTLTGKLSIAIMACESLVEKAVVEFQKEHPNVCFELYSSAKQSGNADFYVSDELFYIRGCVKKQLIEEKTVLVIPNSHQLSSRESVSVKELQKEKFVCTNQGTIIHHRLSSLCFDNGFVPNITVTVTSPEKAVKYITEGFAIGIFPETEIEKSEGITIKKLDPYTRKVCVFYEENRLKARINQLFLEKLLEIGSSY